MNLFFFTQTNKYFTLENIFKEIHFYQITKFA